MGTPLKLLIVEDSPDDAELVCIELERAGFDLAWKRVETEATFIAALRDEVWDLVISDFQMPDFNGLRAFALFKGSGLDIPFIFVSGALGEDRAVEAMRAGARDYLLKGNLTRLNVAVARELEEAKNRRGQREAEQQARSDARRLALAVEASGAGIFEFRVPLGPDANVSERWAQIFGYRSDELPQGEALLAWTTERLHPDDAAAAEEAYEAFLSGRSQRLQTEARHRHRDGKWVTVMSLARAIERDSEGRAVHAVGVLLDVTERKLMEAQLRQSQKMEAVGRLAGGIAHDFNNLLTAIFSFGTFALEATKPEDPAHEDLQEVLKAAQRAASLTSQLLAFSRRRTVQPRVINPAEVVRDVDKMLRRLLGADVDFLTKLAEDSWNVRMDPSAFEQVLVNLAINARDAMPDGGRLTIETANVELDQGYGRAHGAYVPAGAYVRVAVSDTGIGMDAATQANIFEPFFTTKGAGEGTGLGLSTCYGIVKQAGGNIWVYSELGHGTTFKIYLPREADLTEARRPTLSRSPERGSEFVLLVEDDEQVRTLAVRTLRRLGYTVLEAVNGRDALDKCQQVGRPLDLVITDVIMPVMSGKELVERLTEVQPGLKTLFMSGYTPDAIVHRGVLARGTLMLQKPFTPQQLAEKIREALDVIED
jgi:hypothetical protein